LRCEVRAEQSDRWSVRHTGPESPDDEFDLVVDAAQRAVGRDRPLELIVDNYIPIGKGLGSSAAAAAAGAIAAWRALDREPTADQAFQLVAEMEDHPDNAAAAIFGGLVLCPPDGKVRRLSLHPSLKPLLAIPRDAFPTVEAREALDTSVSRAMAVRSLGRMGSLVLGLVNGDDSLLAGAAGDEMHEAPRNGIRPNVRETIEAARAAGASHVCWSGAGPGVLALVKEERETAVREALGVAMPGSEVRRLAVATEGYR
jgi:homoserine kinase